MPRRTVEVECYAGSRADERPRRVRAGNRDYRVARLLSTSVAESVTTRQQVRSYRVLTEDGWILDLARAGDGRWTLEGKRLME